ncbi:MAG TPA: hypothetical protein ENJ95_19945 [Bacteroidetes bacterium]|nr:hypothetical protein [Bacteroidota bacterium]
MKYILLLPLLMLGDFLFGQVKPDIFPEDIGTPGEQVVRCYCKPGVRNKSRSKGLELVYATRGGGTFESEDESIVAPFSRYKNWQRFELDLKAPVIRKEGFKLLLGYKYSAELFDFSNIGNDFPETFQELDRVTLKTSNLSVIVNRPLNESKYLAFRFRYSANGAYGGALNFASRNAIYKLTGVFGIKKSEDFEWGFGINFSKSFRQPNILPFVLYNRNFHNNWGLEAAFPGYVYVRYNLGPKTIFLVGTEYESKSYRMSVPLANDEQLDYALNHSELLGLLRMEQQVAPWVWANMRVGYQMNFSTDFEAKAANTNAFLVEPTNSVFFEVGIFISPPSTR